MSKMKPLQWNDMVLRTKEWPFPMTVAKVVWDNPTARFIVYMHRSAHEIISSHPLHPTATLDEAKAAAETIYRMGL